MEGEKVGPGRCLSLALAREYHYDALCKNPQVGVTRTLHGDTPRYTCPRVYCHGLLYRRAQHSSAVGLSGRASIILTVHTAQHC